MKRIFCYCVLFLLYRICNEPRQNLGRELSWVAIVRTKIFIFIYLFVKNYVVTQGEDFNSKRA